MINEDKKKLVCELSKQDNFYAYYSRDNREWFVSKLIDHFESQVLSDSETKQKIQDMLIKAKSIVKSKKDFGIGVPLKKGLRIANRRRRVEILYGAIAAHPDFVNPAHSSFLDFIAKRRYRSVVRMDYFVNPNRQGYFRYPHKCPSDASWRVNDEAKPYWERAIPDEEYPIKLKPPSTGSVNPVTAIQSLYIKKADPCEGNLLDCSTVTSIVLMDTLFEANDEDKLLKKIYSKSPVHLAIAHPNSSPNDNFMTDTSGESLFLKADVKIANLQVGDHIYIYNHPLYKVFRPNGSWRGEHSLVYNTGNRNYKSKRGYFFGGHGKEGTIYKLYKSFLKELKTYLHRSYRIGGIHLKYMESGSTSIESGVTHSSHTINVGGVSDTYTLHEYNVWFRYRDYTKPPSSSEPKPELREKGFVIAQLAGSPVFHIARKKTIADVVNEGEIKHPITFKGPVPATPGSISYDPVGWGISYKDSSTGTDLKYDLYQRVHGRVQIKQLKINHLFASPFYKKNPGVQNVYATLPRVDFSSHYKQFLEVNGGL